MDSQSRLKIFITYLLLAIIIASSISLRLFRIGESPPSLNWDEASLGYNAYSLLKTGKDEYSRVLPLSLRSFDDYKPAIYTYLIIPSLLKIPLSDVAVRMPSAILGGLLPGIIFIISFLLTKSRKVGLITALTLATEPWSFHFSRIAFESNIANTFLYLGLALFIYSWQTKKQFYWSIIFFILSMYTYHSERAIALPILGLLLFSFKKQLSQINKKAVVLSASLILILLIPLAISFFKEPITSRLATTNVLKLWPFVPAGYSRTIYNPVFTMIWHISSHFASYFSPFNIFVRGSTEPGQYIPTLGLLQIVEFPFWVLGIFIGLKNKILRHFLWPIMVMATIPALITWNWFSVVRTLSLYPIYSLFIGLGVVHFINLVRPKLFKLIFGIALFLGWSVSSIYVITTETIYAPSITYGEYQPGFEQAIPVLLTQAINYDHVVIDSPHIAPYIFLLFYGQYDPKIYQQQNPNINRNIGTENKSFGKFVFRKIDWDSDQYLPHTLFMGPTVRLPGYEFTEGKPGKIIKDTYDAKGYIGFRIVATK